MPEIINFQNKRDDELRRKIEENIQKGKVVGESSKKQRELAEDMVKELKDVNSRHAYIKYLGGKPAVTWNVYNEYHDREITKFVTPDHFQSVYCNELAPDEGKRGGDITIGKWWIGNPHRREYDTAVFDPSKPPGEYEWNGKSMFNTWEGFNIEPKQGDWSLTQRHIWEILCNKKRDRFVYVVKWLAWCIQNPGKQAEVALIFKGKKGAGKGTILSHFAKIFGIHGMVLNNKDQLLGKHNAHLAQTSFLFADEGTFIGDKETEGTLKSLITESSITVEPKFREISLTKNCLHIVMATNNDWIINATEDERRFFITETDNRYAKGMCPDAIRDKYFNRLWEELEPKDGSKAGLAAMLYDLQKMDLKDYHPRYNVPETEEMKKQVQLSLPKVKYAILSIIEEGVFPGEKKDGKYIITINSLVNHIQNTDPSMKNVSQKSMQNFLTSLGLIRLKTGTKNYWVFPELGAMRAIWYEKVFQHEMDPNAVWHVETTQY